MPVEIRTLDAADEAAWRELWTAYLTFYGTTVPEEVYKTTFARLTDRADESMGCFLAISDDEPIGLVNFIFHAHCWRPEGICYLQDLYAVPEARGFGVGRALIEAVYAHADACGVPGVYWMTQDFNETARTLYDRVGSPTPFIKYERPKDAA
ncbi:GNAT family N-acetyltransferase [Pelagovum pacificum]|uniref:GNAT family N-acetyltransferase n=1 Tax=Pelagovum pacificum TaxID=2588711 RepID=A0A5C5GHP3_9RHOB|nr:GNAT family N-acetyltransferase [Pelagovum pacificum]QQA44943.1 GNAT family N-acetyltransferase [Pelagovum pacificum]TNY34298.1 GNAT family N-acetyltransferase [Pelagovum pacificum]